MPNEYYSYSEIMNQLWEKHTSYAPLNTLNAPPDNTVSAEPTFNGPSDEEIDWYDQRKVSSIQYQQVKQ